MQIVPPLFCVLELTMHFFSHKPTPLDVRAVYEEYQQQIDALVDALEAGDPNVDLKLAAIVEGTQDQVRIAIVEKMREMIAERDAEKAKLLDEIIAQQKLLQQEQKSAAKQQFLAYFMSEQTRRKLREAFFANPVLQRQVENIGEDLAKKGVIGQTLSNKQDLGGLSTNLTASQGPRQDKGKGR